MKVSALTAVLPAASVPVTVSPGELAVPADQPNAPET